MEVESVPVLEQLQQRIEILKDMYLKLRQEKEALLNDKIGLTQTIAEKDVRITELETKYNTLQMAKAVAMETEDNEVAKKKLNGIVREIDKCIALLNK